MGSPFPVNYLSTGIVELLIFGIEKEAFSAAGRRRPVPDGSVTDC
jgi:hypothetical protein